MSDDENCSNPYPVNKQALKALQSLPARIGIQFIQDLSQISLGLKPGLEVSSLEAVGKGVFELKINGRPAHRCVYCRDSKGRVAILHAFAKTTNGVDRANIDTAKKRFNLL